MKRISIVLLLGTSISYGAEKNPVGGICGNHNQSTLNVSAGGSVHINSPTHHHTYNHQEKISFEDFKIKMDTHLSSLHALFQSDEFKSNPSCHGILVIGPTGAGKSTFLNWLKGVKLRSEKIPKRRKFKLTALNPLFSIGHDGRTGTFFPNFIPYLKEGKNFHFWDIPGLHSVNGTSSDIIKILEIVEIVKKYDKVSVLLLINETRCLETRGPEIIYFLNQLNDIFKNYDNYLNFIITQKEEENANGEIFKENYLEIDENNLHIKMKEMLSSLLSSSYFEMKAPLEEGEFAPPSLEFTEHLFYSLNERCVENPVLIMSLNGDQTSLVRLYGDKINKEIKTIFDQSAPSLHAVLDHSLTHFQGGRHELMAKIQGLYELFEVFSMNEFDEGRYLHTLEQLSQMEGGQELRRVSSYLQTLSNLRDICRQDAHIVSSTPHTWISGEFNRCFSNIVGNRGREFLSMPNAISTVSEGENQMRRVEEFRIIPFEKDHSYRIQTETLGMLRFEHQDASLQSLQVLTFPSFAPYPFEESVPIPYTPRPIVVNYVANSLNENTRTAAVNVVRSYNRPGNGGRLDLYSQETLRNIHITRSRITNDDYFETYTQFNCSSTYEGVSLHFTQNGGDRAYLPCVKHFADQRETAYRRYIRGVLIYKPDPYSNTGRVEFPFADVVKREQTMCGQIVLKGCGNANEYFVMCIGRRPGRWHLHKNRIEIWIAPKFATEGIGHYNHIQSMFASELAIFRTWGNWDTNEWFDYCLTEGFSSIQRKNFWEMFPEIQHHPRIWFGYEFNPGEADRRANEFIAYSKRFFLYFP